VSGPSPSAPNFGANAGTAVVDAGRVSSIARTVDGHFEAHCDLEVSRACPQCGEPNPRTSDDGEVYCCRCLSLLPPVEKYPRVEDVRFKPPKIPLLAAVFLWGARKLRAIAGEL
jgi:hypothetical protein